MSQEIYDVLFHLAELVGAGTCGGLIVLLFDYTLSVFREQKLKRERFRNYIELLIKKIESVESNAFVHDFKLELRDVSGFDDEILDVRQFIPRCRKSRFDAASAEYKSVRFGVYGDKQTNENAKEKLLSILKEISKCAR
jgi:hypothetical protein